MALEDLSDIIPESDKMGWIGVDLDGTLAEYHGFKADHSIGPPVPLMLQRVKQWLAEGKDVRIFTARIAHAEGAYDRKLIEEWCLTHIGMVLPVTCEKDMRMMELWDDRAVQVIPNTGIRADGEED
jgi:hypothetical protein